MRKVLLRLMLLTLVLTSGCTNGLNHKDKQTNESSSLIPREILYGNPDKTSVQLSPDGSRISYLAPVNGVINIWVGLVDSPKEAKPITNDTNRGINNYIWAYMRDQLIFIQDRDGDENWQVYCINISNGNVKELTPFKGIQARILAVSYKFPEEIIIGLNNRDPRYHDIYRMNITTGNMTLVMENNEFSKFKIDNDYKIRFAEKMTPDGGREVFMPDDRKKWKLFLNIGVEDELSTEILGFDKTGNAIYLKDCQGRDTSALFAQNLETGERSLIAQDPESDLSDTLIHPIEKNVQAVAFNYQRPYWLAFDETIARDLDYLRTVNDGDLYVMSRTLDDDAWVVLYVSDCSPGDFYYFSRSRGDAKFLFPAYSELEGMPHNRMNPVIIKSRDGLNLVSYYTLPNSSDSDFDGIPDKPLPMVLLVHSGPWGRDMWGYYTTHQWLASRGYAVLSVNFRGSTGFGKNFTNAGNLEWGRKMQEDLIDGVNWTVETGIADLKRIAIMGTSYGGYAALAGLAFTPETFACGVDLCGPSNLTTFAESIPPYWRQSKERFKNRMGDCSTAEGQALLAERSPANYVDRIKRPLLICQGANDPRVKKNESDQIVQFMQQRNLSVTYVLFPDEGHLLVRPENRIAFYAVVEAFLSKHLGGRFEPVGDDFQGSSIMVPVGAMWVLGLEEALLESP